MTYSREEDPNLITQMPSLCVPHPRTDTHVLSTAAVGLSVLAAIRRPRSFRSARRSP